MVNLSATEVACETLLLFSGCSFATAMMYHGGVYLSHRGGFTTWYLGTLVVMGAGGYIWIRCVGFANGTVTALFSEMEWQNAWNWNRGRSAT